MLAKTPAIVLAALSGVAHADDLTDARALGTGELTVANPDANPAFYVNPATMALSEQYNLAGMVSFGPGSTTNRYRWGLSATDSQSNDSLSLGIAYIGTISNPAFRDGELPGWELSDVDPENRKLTNDIHLGAATSFLDRRVSLGVTGYLSIFNNDWNGKGTTGNLTFGLSAMPIPQLALGVSARDVLPLDDQFDRPATVSFGVHAMPLEVLRIGAQAAWAWEDLNGARAWNANAGFEASVQSLRLRGGYSWAGFEEQHRMHLGIGAANDAGDVSYGLYIPVTGTDDIGRSMVHTISVTLFTGTLGRQQGDDAMIMQQPGGGTPFGN